MITASTQPTGECIKCVDADSVYHAVKDSLWDQNDGIAAYELKIGDNTFGRSVPLDSAENKKACVERLAISARVLAQVILNAESGTIKNGVTENNAI